MNFSPKIKTSRRSISFFLFLCFLTLSLTNLLAQIPTFPAGFSRVLISNALNNPTVMAFAPDGRIFLAEQNGQLRIIKNGALLPVPFVKINVNSFTERGLIGVALDPNFSTNQYVYVYYTLPDGSRNRISRFTGNGDLAVGGSELILLTLDPLNGEMHNGGAMHFGLDGKLYVATGENNIPGNAQNLDNYLGKILRINPDGSVPPGNPFTSGSEARKRIWAYGFRNPFTFAIHPTTGKIFVNDVGNNNWEEINDATQAGRNFGWPHIEGAGTNIELTNPLFAYPHTGTGVRGCAVTGGTFFDPVSTNYPDTYKGKYFFQDLCFRWINVLDYSNGDAVVTPFATNLGAQAVSVTLGKDGNLYYIERETSSLYKIIYSTNATPTVVSQPLNVTVSEGQPAQFSIAATGTPTLRYQWQKNGVNIVGATQSSFRISTTVKADEGSYRCIVTNNVGTITSNAATLTLTAFNAPPIAQISKPTAGSFYRAGDVIQFEGSATDPEDGVLPASAFTWYSYLYHGTHRHDGPPIAWSVKSGSFTIPTTGETSDDVWFRLFLIVSDSRNLTDTAFVDILPNKSKITLATQPAGLQLTLDGSPVNTPLTVTGVEGIRRSIGVVTPQTPVGKYYTFANWTHGGNATQTISTPVNDVTYTAVFNEIVLREAVNPVNLVNGLDYSYYEGTGWTKIPNYDAMTPIKSGTVSNIDISVRNREDNFGFKFTGYIEVPYDDAFTFTLRSDDGAKLFIGNTLVIDLDGNHAAWDRSGVIGLKKGKHPLTILYFDKEFGQELSLSYQGLNLTKKLVPASALFRQTASPQLPSITTQPREVSAGEGSNVSFSVSATGSAPLTYQWQKNSVNIPGATGSIYSIANVQSTHVGGYRVIVSNAAGSATSNTAQLTVTAPNMVPLAEILTPAQGSFYRGGETVNFSGNGTDPEDGTLPASAFTWKVDFFHDTHSHSGPTVSSGVKNGSFVIPVTGETSHNVFYRISLIVTDSRGAKDTVFRDIFPYKSLISLATQPPGLQLSLDNSTVATPHSVNSVEGIQRTLGVVTPQTSGGKSYKFSRWLHGGNSTQTISTPITDVTYTAVFVEDIPTPGQNGLNYAYYHGTWTKLPNFDLLIPVKKGTVPNIDLSPRTQENYFGFVFTGFIDIPVSASYTFYLKSDDGSKLFIDNALVIDLDGNHAAWERSSVLSLIKGRHAIRVIYFDKEYDHVLSLSWARPGVSKQLVPASAYYTSGQATRTTNNSPEAANINIQQIMLYPNPSTDHITVEIWAEKGEKITVWALDKVGKSLKSKSIIPPQSGLSNVVLDVADLSNNSYIMKVQKGKSVFFKHFIVNK